jgi:putative hemolysin
VIWLLSHSTNVVVRLLGGDPHREREEITTEELRDLVASQVSFTAQQRAIISGAFELAERPLHDVLRPRPDVLTLDAGPRVPSALEILAASGHSRAPVGAGGLLDDVVGVVHLRDLLRGGPATTSDRWPRRRRCCRSRPGCSTPSGRCSTAGRSWRWWSTSTVAPRAS